jgi:hypothetical protein
VANEIFYCSRCQVRLFGQQFLEGTAFRVRDQFSCENCLGDIVAPLSLEEQQEILLQVKALKDSQVLEDLPEVPINEEEFFELDTPDQAGQAHDDYFELDTPEKERKSRPRAVLSGPSRSAAREESQNRAVVIFLFCLVGIAMLGSFLYYSSSPEITPTPVGGFKPAPAPYNPSLKTYDDRSTMPNPRTADAKAALEKAREFVRANPADFSGQQEVVKKSVDAAEGTPVVQEARREYEELLQKQKETLAREFGALDKETAAAVEKEEFKPAMEKLEQSKTRYNVGEWRGGVDLRTRNLRNVIWKALFPLRDKAVAAKQAKNDAEVKAITDRVAKWGLPEFSRDLANSLGEGASSTPAPPPTADLKPPSNEVKTYEVRWRQAIESATRRDYDGALAALDKAVADLKEQDVKAAVTADNDILRKIQSIYRDALQAILAWGRNEKIPLEYLDENLNNERSDDPFIRADSERIEVARGGAPYPIEISEVTARSLANLLRKRKPELSEADGRALALLCLVEGDIDSARQNFTGPQDQIPYKYWSLATKVAESRSGITEAGKREMAARKLYFTSERSYPYARERGAAVQGYRELLQLYPDTSIVKRRRSQIEARRDGAKEYVFLPDDFDVAGTFKSGKQPKFGECWTSNSDSDPRSGVYNYVNVKFYALPEVTYQCWAYVGGCCAEVFAATYQATDLTYTKGSEVLKIEPGGNNALGIRHTVSFLKPSHAAHGGPKESKLWHWAELKLPKYPQPGIKDVRLMTDQKAFSVAFILVSATRSGPPSESEMRSWIKKPETTATAPEEKPAAVEAAVAIAETRDPSLVGHWKLDEGGGVVMDASGRDNSGVLAGEPSRVPGKFGGAVAFDGKERYVGIPNSEILDNVQENAYTLVCWFKPNTKPGNPNDAAYAVVAKSPQHEGITYNADQKFVMDHVLANNTAVTAVSAAAFPPGAYYHVAGVVNRSEGAVRIYVNGKLEGTATFTAGAAAKDFKNETWKLGIASPGAGPQRLAADGIIDDVRIYTRALQPGDLKSIAGITGGAPPSIVITSPLPGEKFDAGATITLGASASPLERVAKLDFYAGGTLLGSRTGPPFTFTWNKVAGGSYIITARVTDRSGAVTTSTPLTIRVGNPTLYRAINLGGGAMRVDGVDFEAGNAKGVSCNGTAHDIKSELIPAPDAALAPLLKRAVVHNLGTSVSLINIPNGAYQVSLYVCAEGSPQTYDIVIAGQVVQYKIKSGPPGTWQKLGPWTVDSSGGLLEIAAKGGEVNFCALEVWRVSK